MPRPQSGKAPPADFSAQLDIADGPPGVAEASQKFIMDVRDLWPPPGRRTAPPRPQQVRGRAASSSWSAPTSPPATSPPPSPNWWRGSRRASTTRCCWASPARARPSPWPRSSRPTQRPALILAPNKTLAAQLYGEFKNFFPDNAVEYFVSYYDYYQPEAYVPRTDTYHREGLVDERADRPDAALGHPGDPGAGRRDHRRLGLLHLRHRLGGDLHRHDLRA